LTPAIFGHSLSDVTIVQLFERDNYHCPITGVRDYGRPRDRVAIEWGWEENVTELDAASGTLSDALSVSRIFT
jgi:hypothetical protein